MGLLDVLGSVVGGAIGGIGDTETFPTPPEWKVYVDKQPKKKVEKKQSKDKVQDAIDKEVEKLKGV